MSSSMTLDALAAGWLGWAWRAGCASLLLLALLLALRPLIRRYASTHAASWLYLLPIVPLVVPPLAAAPFALPTPAPPPAVRGAITEAASRSANAPTPIASPQASAAAHTSAAALHGEVVETRVSSAAPAPATFLVIGWWSASLAVLLAFLARQRPLQRLTRAARACDDAALARRFRVLAREAGVDERVELRLTDELASPATAGFWRPVVLVPSALLEQLDTQALEWILRHELAHVRRRDVPIEAALRVVRALWLFHPAAWLCPALAARERELACDEAALARSGDELGTRAARALLCVLEFGRSHPAALVGPVPFLSPQSLHRNRIMRLLEPDHKATSGLRPLSALLLFAAVAAATPSALPPVVSEATASAPTEAPVAADELDATLAGALEFLVANQQDDGRWRATDAPKGKGCGEFDDVGVTGLALLALADAPESISVSGAAEAIERGLAFLLAGQDPERGAFPQIEGNMFAVPSHAIALRAFIRANQGSPNDAWREPAQRAIDFVLSARNPYAAWRYDVQPSGDNDAVITSWALLALAEARAAGLEVDEEALRGGLDLLDELYDAGTGRTGYTTRGNPTSRIVGKKEDFPGEEVELPTALAICARTALGQDPLETDAVLAGTTLLLRKPPTWSRARGTIDSYYWAAGTCAMRAIGGAFAERWDEALREALLEHSDTDPEGRAYWPAIDAWSCEGGDVHMTAMCALALEAVR